MYRHASDIKNNTIRKMGDEKSLGYDSEDEQNGLITRRTFARQAFLASIGTLVSGPSAFGLPSPFEDAGELNDDIPQRRLKGTHAFIHGEDEPLSADLSVNADKKFYTASLIKLVTLACMFEDVCDGKISWDDEIKVSNRAMRMSSQTSWFPNLTVRQACENAGSASLNDAAIAIAEHLGKHDAVSGYITDRKSIALEQHFVENRMNPLVKALGMSDTLCANATGFPIYSAREIRGGRKSMTDMPNNYSTLNDLQKLTTHILSEYPEFMDVFSMPYVMMHAKKPTKIYTTNMLLPGNKKSKAEPYEGVIGMKTGFINASHSHLICAKEIDGKTLVSMTIGSKPSERVADQRAAMDRAVQAYEDRLTIKMAQLPEP